MIVLILFCLELKDKVLKSTVFLHLACMVILALNLGSRLDEPTHLFVPVSLVFSFIAFHQLEVIYQKLQIQLPLIKAPSLPSC